MHVKAALPETFFPFFMDTIYDFAKPKTIEALLIKERLKMCKRNRKHNEKCRNKNVENPPKHFNFSDHLNEPTHSMSVRIGINFIMPPRGSWARPNKNHREKAENDWQEQMTQSLKSTLKRDRRILNSIDKDSKGLPILEGRYKRLNYLVRLDDYIEKIRNIFRGNKLKFSKPDIVYILKKKTDKYWEYRPLAIFNHLDDKIILAIVSRYLAEKLNKHLHENILSYRPKRYFLNELIATDFNTGIKTIGEYRARMKDANIYVADCDIQKFYDTINHDIVKECFNRILDKTGLTDEAKRQVNMVLDAYLNSYDFYNDAFFKQINKRVPNDVEKKVKWAKEEDFVKCYGSKEKFEQARDSKKIGVPQGGALSLLIANVVLNDIDSHVINKNDKQLFFSRFCDDMVLMHTNLDACRSAIVTYTNELNAHYLVYHKFSNISDLKNGNLTLKRFWQEKSHMPFLWGSGPNGHNWVGFLGYEMNRKGQIRLRLSNVEKFEVHIRSKFHRLDRRFKKGFLNDNQRKKFIREIEKARARTDREVLYKSYTSINDNIFIRHQKDRINYCRKLFLIKFLEKRKNQILSKLSLS